MTDSSIGLRTYNLPEFLYINVISYIVVMNVFPRQMENTQAIAREFSNIFNVLEGKYSWLTPTN